MVLFNIRQINELSYLSIEPATHVKAMKHPHWEQAMDIEFATLIKNKTWRLAPPRHDMNIIDCKWVLNSKGKQMAQLIDTKPVSLQKGFKQKYGIDYIDAYSLIVKPTNSGHLVYCNL